MNFPFSFSLCIKEETWKRKGRSVALGVVLAPLPGRAQIWRERLVCRETLIKRGVLCSEPGTSKFMLVPTISFHLAMRVLL